MKRHKLKNIIGFTLIEMILVMVIISVILIMLAHYYQQRAITTRVNRTVYELQAILNAGLGFYMQNSGWPPPAVDATNSIACLYGSEASPCNVAYLPKSLSSSAFGSPYLMSWYSPWSCPQAVNGTNTTCTVFYVFTEINAGELTYAVSNSIVGKFPLAYTVDASNGKIVIGNGNPPSQGPTCNAASTSCYVVAMENIPGQSMNSAQSVKFAGVYHHGACVPVPVCPLNMTPQIMVSPISVSGFNTANGSGAPTDVYAISSFSAIALADNANKGNLDNTPSACPIVTPNGTVTDPKSPSCTSNNSGPTPPSNAYWRVCLQVVTEQGNVASTYTNAGTNFPAVPWGEYVTLMAVTRCAAQGAAAGSDYTTVYSN